jgi:hypothetical protein
MACTTCKLYACIAVSDGWTNRTTEEEVDEEDSLFNMACPGTVVAKIHFNTCTGVGSSVVPEDDTEDVVPSPYFWILLLLGLLLPLIVIVLLLVLVRAFLADTVEIVISSSVGSGCVRDEDKEEEKDGTITVGNTGSTAAAAVSSVFFAILLLGRL